MALQLNQNGLKSCKSEQSMKKPFFFFFFLSQLDSTKSPYPGSNELTVKKGDEVIIITRPKEERGWYEV